MRRAPVAALAVGVAALAATGAGLVVEPARAYPSYLFAYTYWLGLTLGATALAMVHRVTGGAWGEVLAAPLAAAARAMPLMALLFLPLIGGLAALYPWWSAAPGGPYAELLQAKLWYLNRPFFLVRAAAYFALWLWLARVGPRSLRASAGGLIVYALSISLASVDWIASLVPEFFSSIFGMLIGVGQILAGTAFAVAWVATRRRGERALPATRVLDLGNLLLMLVLAWAYLAVSQFVTIWVADLPPEISWFVPRQQTSWRWVALVLLLAHFALPFFVLLSRAAKRSAAAVAAVAWTLLAAHLVYAFWLVAPVVRPHGFAFAWTDFTAPAGIGGVWLARVLRANLSSSGTSHETSGASSRSAQPAR